ncbi:hypothetical protein G5C51_21955 [Streptomyces sp. A7024]|uniref:Secreted protein n=1 Tax=Streptomyces coryli TaxID=1128680 RepID=A0A6G4U395_9ACTN|nr:hypothetical protein [Streptomyces coryli]NGN66553.1 hypothetical protein [Streptomyces coryli]
MASIRTARIIAAVASVPLAAALLSGVAQADNGAFANNHSISGATSQEAGGGNYGIGNNSSNTQQSNVGVGNSNTSTTVTGDGNVVFSPLW